MKNSQFTIVDRTGETTTALNGQKMTIVAYRSSRDMDVQFEDGTIVTGIRYTSFRDKMVKNPNCLIRRGRRLNKEEQKKLAKNRLGETITATNGQKMTIITYRKSTDIDVRFEDGTVVEHRAYLNFKKGRIANPSTDIKSVQHRHLTEKEKKKIVALAKTGKTTTEIAVRLNRSENGIRETISGAGIADEHRAVIKDLQNRTKVGETSYSESGQKMTIIACRGVTDIDVQFEDGNIACGRSYRDFTRGWIRNPGENYSFIKDRTGETKTTEDGQVMTISRYGNSKDIDVTFGDGSVIEHTSYNNFIKGYLKNPSIPKIKKMPDLKGLADKRIGETSIASNGQLMTLIRYRGALDVDVRFEDGTEVCNRHYDNFLRGTIKNPNRPTYVKNNTTKEETTVMATSDSTKKTGRKLKDRNGETIRSKNGTEGVIVAYRGVNDVDIRLNDGTVLEHVRYWDFVHKYYRAPGEPDTTKKAVKREIYKDIVDTARRTRMASDTSLTDTEGTEESVPTESDISSTEEVLAEPDKANNTTIRQRSIDEIREIGNRIADMVLSGMERKSICQELGIGKTTLYKYLRIAGLSINVLRGQVPTTPKEVKKPAIQNTPEAVTATTNKPSARPIFLKAVDAICKLKTHLKLEQTEETDAELAKMLDISPLVIKVFSRGGYREARKYIQLLNASNQALGIDESFFYDHDEMADLKNDKKDVSHMGNTMQSAPEESMATALSAQAEYPSFYVEDMTDEFQEMDGSIQLEKSVYDRLKALEGRKRQYTHTAVLNQLIKDGLSKYGY
jgi:DNA-binding CsgD family transcriptional regulator